MTKPSSFSNFFRSALVTTVMLDFLKVSRLSFSFLAALTRSWESRGEHQRRMAVIAIAHFFMLFCLLII